MHSILQRGAIAAVTAGVAFTGLAGTAGAKTVAGIVVHHNARAHSFVVADRAGHMYAIHASRAPQIGSQVVVAAKRLHDGTYLLERSRVVAHVSRSARIRGVVTWADKRTGSFVISAAGVSLLVSHRAGRMAHAAGAASTPATPSVGSDVVASGTLDSQGDLEDQSVQTVGQNTGPMSLEGTVLAVDTTAQTITVSADDSEQSGASITVSIPSTLSITQFAAGQEVELMVQPTGPGTATLLGAANDASAQAANDQTDTQGQNPASGDSTDQTDSGSGSSSDSQSQQNSTNSSGGDSSTSTDTQTQTTGTQTQTTGTQTQTTGTQTQTTGTQTQTTGTQTQTTGTQTQTTTTPSGTDG
jgi:hypothetical protein